MLRKILTLLCFILPGIAFAATEIDRVYAIVNDDVVTRTEYEQEYLNTTMELRARGRVLPEEPVLRRQILDRIITEKLQLQVANQVGVQVSRSQVDLTISDLARRNNMSIDQMKQALEQDGISYSSFIRRIEDQLKIQQVIEYRINARVEVSDEEIEEFLQAEKRGGGLNSEYNVSHIIVPITSATDEGYDLARQRIEQARAAILAGADFAQVAARYSGYEDALDGGEIGWRKSGELPSLYFQELRTMQAGQVSDVLQSENAFHLVKLNQLRTPDSGTGQQIVQSRLRQIYLKLQPQQTTEFLKIHLSEISKRLDSGEDFASLASQYSEDPESRIKGGDMGWIGPGDLSAVIERELYQMPVGQISQPMQVGNGVSIYEVTDRREQDGSEILEINAAREQLHIRKAEQMYQDWLQDLRDSAYIQYMADDLG